MRFGDGRLKQENAAHARNQRGPGENKLLEPATTTSGYRKQVETVKCQTAEFHRVHVSQVGWKESLR